MDVRHGGRAVPAGGAIVIAALSLLAFLSGVVTIAAFIKFLLLVDALAERVPVRPVEGDPHRALCGTCGATALHGRRCASCGGASWVRLGSLGVRLNAEEVRA